MASNTYYVGGVKYYNGAPVSATTGSPTATGYNPLTGAGPGITTPTPYYDPNYSAPYGTTGSTGYNTGGTSTPTSTQPAPAPAPTTTPIPAAFSASQILDNMLFAALGIHGAGAWAAGLAAAGAKDEEIVNALRYGTDKSAAGQMVYQQYLAAFPGMDQFLNDGTFAGANPELQYINYRNSVKDAAARYGVNDSLVSAENIRKMIAGHNSYDEIVARMNTAATAIASTPAETYAKLNEYYGITGNDLMSFYLDTDNTEAELQKRYTAARIGTEAARNTFGIDRVFAENLAQRGVSVDQATKGFGTAYTERGFMDGRGDVIDQSGLINAQFGDAAQASVVDRVAASRTGRFQAGGSYTGSDKGLTGIGSSST